MRPEAAQRLADILQSSSCSDPYQLLQRITISRGSVRERALFEFFGLYQPPAVAIDQTPGLELQPTDYGLFSHQRGAARQIRALLAEEPYRAVLHMPTGAGKTRTAMHVLADHLRASEPALVVWLAHSEELCEQAASEFMRGWKHLGDREIQIHRFWGNRSVDPNELRDGLLVAGLAKTYRTAKADLEFINKLSSRCSLVVIDEAHQAVAETYRLVLDTLVQQRPATALLGLTATPGRTWADVAADQELADFFRRRKVSLQVPGYANPIDYLVDNRYLARTVYRSLFHNSGLRLTEADLEYIRSELDLPREVLRRLAEDEQRNLRIILEIEDLAKRHDRILAFAISVEHAHLLAAVLRARSWQASSITATTPSEIRGRLISEFRDTDPGVRILCNYGVLTAGFDAPRTSAALIARPTASLVLYSQMIGRAMRGPRAGGNETAEIVTVIDRDLPGFCSMADTFSNWEDVWD